MKKIFSFLKVETFKNNIKEAFTRFPVSFIIILIIAWLFYTQLHWSFSNETENQIFRSIFALVITWFLSLWINITKENLNINWYKKYLLNLFPIIFWFLFYLGFSSNIDNFENFIFFLLTLAWIISYLFIAPYINKTCDKKFKEKIYYSYFSHISLVFLLSFFLWLVLFLLWYIWIAAVFELFDLSWTNSSKLYWDWAIFALSMFSPIYALSQLPKQKEYNKSNIKENVFFTFLIKYIATPFIYIYFIILYSYTVKVLLNFSDWPKWEVSWMVIWFSIFWYLIYIFSYILEEKIKFINTFRKMFPYVVIPQVFMLFYAIYLRINQYDLTINRYFVVVFWLWLLTISLYFILSKKKKIITIPAILTLFTIIISIWPWSVYNLPETRQYNRLTTNLEIAWILENNTIKALDDYSEIDQNLSKNIYSWIDYLCDFNECNKIKELFSVQYNELYQENKKDFEERKKTDLIKYENNPEVLEEINKRIYNWPSKWEIVSYITEYIQVKNYFETEEERSILRFYLDNNQWVFPIDIKWYSEIYRIWTYWEWIYAEMDIENKKLLIKDKNIIIEEVDISSLINSLIEKYKNEGILTLSKNEASFEIDNYKILIENINIKNPLYNWVENFYEFSNWYLLKK